MYPYMSTANKLNRIAFKFSGKSTPVRIFKLFLYFTLPKLPFGSFYELKSLFN